MKPGFLAALLVCGLPACESANCTPTVLVASPATKVDVRMPGSSAVLTAVLTAGGPLSGRTLSVELLASGSSVHGGEVSTDGRGVGRYDVKRADAGALAGLARADEWSASFAGDSTYCSSSDTAAFRLA